MLAGLLKELVVLTVVLVSFERAINMRKDKVYNYIACIEKLLELTRVGNLVGCSDAVP